MKTKEEIEGRLLVLADQAEDGENPGKQKARDQHDALEWVLR